MKIFITGASGQLAKSFLEIYPKDTLHAATKDKLDITNRKQVFSQVEAFGPDIIFHFASMTRGDECARDPKKAYEVNVNGTKNVVDVCKKNDIALLFVSTNEVFDGTKKSAYRETDIPNPITIVGQTKYKAEKIIQDKLKKYFIVRTSWIYGKWSRSFLYLVMAKVKQDKNIQLVTDEVSSPTYSLDLCNGIKKLIETKKYGLYHLNNSGKASRLRFAQEAFRISDISNVKITPVKLDDFKRISKPPLFTPLDNSKAKRMGIVFPTWKNGLKRFLGSVN